MHSETLRHSNFEWFISSEKTVFETAPKTGMLTPNHASFDLGNKL